MKTWRRRTWTVYKVPLIYAAVFPVARHGAVAWSWRRYFIIRVQRFLINVYPGPGRGCRKVPELQTKRTEMNDRMKHTGERRRMQGMMGENGGG